MVHLIGSNTTNGPPVLMTAVLDGDMMQYVANNGSVAPAFVLGRAGYDVWLNNNRGTRFSQKHIKYTIKDKEFWDFSWEEMGVHDTPAAISYVLN